MSAAPSAEEMTVTERRESAEDSLSNTQTKGSPPAEMTADYGTLKPLPSLCSKAASAAMPGSAGKSAGASTESTAS